MPDNGSDTPDPVYNRILEDIDDTTAPEAMSKREARDWLKELISDLEMRVEALNEEIEAGDE